MRDYSNNNSGGYNKFGGGNSYGGGSKFGGGNKFGGGGGDRFNGGDRGNREVTMYKAVCAECGNNCEVPFRPSGEKPVLCDNCFNLQRRNNGNERDGRRDFSGNTFSRSSKPQTFAPQQSNNNDELIQLITTLSNKIDKLISVQNQALPKLKVAKEPKASKEAAAVVQQDVMEKATQEDETV